MILDNVKNQVIGAVAAFIIGVYFGYHYTSEHYQDKMEAAKAKTREDVISLQRQGDEIAAMYTKKIKDLHEKVLTYEQQKRDVLRNSTCNLSVGFVRLYNASAAGEATSPSNVDVAPSGVDTATLLDVLIANNIKYNEVADQLTKLQQFEKTNP